MSKLSILSDNIRAWILIVVILATMGVCSAIIMQIQVVNGENYSNMAESISTVNQEVSAPRGEILDVNSKPLISNKVGFNVIVDKTFFPNNSSEMNRIILETAKILSKDGVSYVDSLPINENEPFEFLENRDSDIKKLKELVFVQSYATADDCVNAMIKLYNIDESYSLEESRIIAGIRYEMQIKTFTYSNRYIFAEDIPIDTVVKIKENSHNLSGVDVVTEAIRVYNGGDIAPHIVGTSGVISAEQYNLLKDSGYGLNDIIGRSGIEKAMEDELRGTEGVRTIDMQGGEVVFNEITTPAISGNTVKLTIDMDYQKNVQEILANHIYWLNNQTSTEAKGVSANAGAIVVTDVKTGAIIAAANAPNYDINEYITDYSAVASGANSPLLNRAFTGLYRPGSTFKTITATAALNEGIITNSDTINCNGVYTYWSDYQPKCTGFHGNINVITALEKSCNIFFYEVGRLMGSDVMSDYASLYGIGSKTGVEIGDTAGYFASPESFLDRNLEWQAGLIVQAAIGQSETYSTPLQLAMVANTIANNGTRYEPYLIDSVNSYNLEKEIYKTEPTIAQVIPDKTGDTFTTIKEGMMKAGAFSPYYYPSESDYYTDYLLTKLPKAVAIKTGTPQMTSSEDTGSAFIGFYPADNPEIAFSGFIEHGEYSKFMIKQIIDAYYDNNYEVVDARNIIDIKNLENEKNVVQN